MVSRVMVSGDPPLFSSEGDFPFDGVAGTHSIIILSFLDAVGATTGGKALPTQNGADLL